MSSCIVETPVYSTTGEVRYLDRLELYKTEKPYEVTFCPANVQHTEAKETNFSLSYWPLVFRDFSSQRNSFSTDIQGFELDRLPTTISAADLKQLDIVESQHHPEVRDFLEKKYDARKVFFFDSTIRDTNPPRNTSAVLKNQQIVKPATDCHVDQSPRSIIRRIIHHFPNEAETLLKQRVRVINIWRPLVWPYHTRPLAFCDWRSTVPEDYVSCDHMTPLWEGETLQVHYNPMHKWWFAKEMDRDDVLLLKMYDSNAEIEGSTVAMCTPHASFNWKDSPESAKPRESLEIRAIVFS